jgi:predicted anti-sigma-YlaC factor YlaD
MTHLSPDQVVDVAEGRADGAAKAHAAGCPSCRATVESVLDAVRLAESDPQPEPSPLFWPHLAARIGEAVRRERVRVSFWRSWGWRLAPLGAAAVLVIAVGVGARLFPGAPGSAPAVPKAAADAPQAALERTADIEVVDDPSWLLVSALSAQVSVEDAEASGALPPGGADKAMLQLDEAERMELARLLREEIGARNPLAPQGPGA